MGGSVARAVRTGIGCTTAVVLLAAGLPATAGVVSAAGAGSTDFVAATVGAPPTAAALRRALPAGVAVTAVTPIGDDLARITVRGALDASGAALVGAALQATPKVAGASPESAVHIDGAAAPVAAGDPIFPDEWDLWDPASTKRAGGYGVDAPRAWQRSTGSAGVVVAVLDTGITDHPDLSGVRLVPGYDFVTGGNGVLTGDGDGWDADAGDPGDACTAGADRTPSSWHGTFVTGEIAAQHGRSGVAGEAPGVSIEPVRVLGACGGAESDLIAAIEWASGGDVPAVPHNAHPAQVVSLSLGAAGPCDDAIRQAVADAWARGVTVVSAAGNDDAPMVGTAPADCPHVVSVAASSRAGNRAAYSNFGTAAMSPTLAAPGGSGNEPVWGDGWTSATGIGAAGNHAVIVGEEGTSMATPRVSAAVALLLSVHQGLSPDEVEVRLVKSVTHFPAGSTCTVVRCGAGVVNAGNLLAATKRFVHATPGTISGTVKVGKRLTVHPGTWHPGATRLTYRWYRDGHPLAATGARYTVRAADRGARLTVKVTATRAGYATAVVITAGRRIAR